MNAQILTAIAVGCIALVVLGVVLTFGAKITGDIRDTQTVGGTSWLVANQTLTGLNSVAGWQGTLGTLLIAFGIIGAFMGLFAFGRSRGKGGM